MKIKTPLLLAGAGLAAAGLYAYRHRHQIQSEITDTLETLEGMQNNRNRIQDNLAIIADQLQQATKLAQDLTYKGRLFEEEAKHRLQQIQTITAKYQVTEETNEALS